MEPVDPLGLWAYLKTYDHTKDVVYVGQLRERFDTFKLDSEKIDIMEAYMRLKDLQTMLSQTAKKVTDDDIKLKLVSGLPGTDYWHQIKVTVMKSDDDLQGTVNSLIAYQRPKKDQAAANAADSNR